MLQIFSHIENTLSQLHQARENHESLNIIASIGLALGNLITTTASGTSTVISAIGHSLTEVIHGVSDLDEGLVTVLGNATSKVIRATGDAVEDVEEGFGEILKSFFGGTSSIILWVRNLLLTLAVIYLGRKELKKLLRPKFGRTTNESDNGLEINEQQMDIIQTNNKDVNRLSLPPQEKKKRNRPFKGTESG